MLPLRPHQTQLLECQQVLHTTAHLALCNPCFIVAWPKPLPEAPARAAERLLSCDFKQTPSSSPRTVGPTYPQRNCLGTSCGLLIVCTCGLLHRWLSQVVDVGSRLFCKHALVLEGFVLQLKHKGYRCL